MRSFTFDPDIVGPWVTARGGGVYMPGTCSAIGRLDAGELVGGVLYEDYNGANVMAHIAGEGQGWLDREFLWMMFDYPFNQLKVNRITGIVPSSNEAARRFDEHLGFVQEAILKDAHPEGDLIVYRMRRDECRWLRKRHGKE